MTSTFNIIELKNPRLKRNIFEAINYIFFLVIGYILLTKTFAFFIFLSKFSWFNEVLFLIILFCEFYFLFYLSVIIKKKIIMDYHVIGTIEFKTNGLKICRKDIIEFDYTNIDNIKYRSDNIINYWSGSYIIEIFLDNGLKMNLRIAAKSINYRSKILYILKFRNDLIQLFYDNNINYTYDRKLKK